MSKFGELINAQVPVLIDFYTEWNESSVSMHPVIRDVAAALGDKAKAPTVDAEKKTTYVNSTSTVSMTPEQFKAIAAKVKALRTLITA